ncbi:unnamed protein product [Scytosiphon promiscuus]
MAPSLAIAVHQAGGAWRPKEIAADARDGSGLNEDVARAAGDGVVAVDEENRKGEHDTPNALGSGQPRLTAAAVDLVARLALNSSPSTFSIMSPEVVPPGEEVATRIQKQSQQQQQQQQHPPQRRRQQHSPLGCLFSPELNKAEVVAVVSEVVCRPGFTLGPGDERRLLNSVRTGRVDVRCMSRLLRWLAGERLARELRERGVGFVGPKGLAAAEPYTTGQGMQRIVQEVIAGGHPAGSRFIVCFSSRYDACSSAIAGVLVDASSPLSRSISKSSGLEFNSRDASGEYSGRGGSPSEETRTPSTCSWSSDTDEDVTPSSPRSSTGAVGAAAVAVERMYPRTTGGAGIAADRHASRSTSGGGKSSGSTFRGGSVGRRHGDVIALLLDEMPEHCRRNGANLDGGGRTADCVAHGGGVYGMRVEEWIDAYGECDGPMLAAWVFPGNKNEMPGTR